MPTVPVIPPVTPPVPPSVTGLATPWIGSQAQVNDSMASQVEALTSKDSKLNQMARTEGLKAANRRGLLNSSMAVGASMDAVLKNVMPIAAQDASQLYGKNQAARAFEYGMTGQEDVQAFESAEAKAVRDWQTSEGVAGRSWQTGERLGSQAFQTAENIAARGWQTAENLSQRGFQGTQAQLDRDLQATLLGKQITEAQRAQIAEITSAQYMQQKGLTQEAAIEAANRELARVLQANDIQARMDELGITHEYAVEMQANEQAFAHGENVAARSWQTAENLAQRGFQGTQANLDRDLQKTMQSRQISEDQRAQIAAITSAQYMQQKGLTQEAAIELANRTLAQTLQANDIRARMNELGVSHEHAVELQANEQAFSHGENLAARTWQTAENLATRKFQGGEAAADRKLEADLQAGRITSEQFMQQNAINATARQATLDRDLEKFLQAGQITEAQRAQLAAITSTEKIDLAHRALDEKLQRNEITSAQYMQQKALAATKAIEGANNELQLTLQNNDIEFRMSEGQLTRDAAVAAQKLDIMFQQTEGKLDRAQEEKMLNLDIAFRMKEGGLDRTAAAAAQDKDIAYRMASGNLDRASAERMQAAEIKANTQIAALDRATQEKIASWNLSATTKNNVAQAITDVERTYAANYATIMANKDMTAAARNSALTMIGTIRTRDFSLVEQAYGTNITW